MLAGLMMDAGFPGLGWWPVTFLGIAVLLELLHRSSVPVALGLGAVSGLTFYLAHVSWTAEYLGPVPWLALSVLESTIFAVGAAAIAFLWALIERVWPTRAGRLVMVPLAVGGTWVARETVAGSWPYGGFAWGRIAYSQSEGPLAPLIAWVGVSGFSFVVVATIVLSIQLLCRRRPPLRSVSAVVALGVLLLAFPVWQPTTSGSLRVAAVQGNGPAGYFDARASGDLIAAQIAATEAAVGTGADVVVWPENSMDEDPLNSATTGRRLTDLSRTLSAPLVVGAITQRDGLYYNSSLVWTPDGPTGLYDKNHPVPFGEYVPDRAFWSLLAPELIDLVKRDYQIGTLAPAVDVGGVKAGVSLCFDIVDDRLITQMIKEDAQIILAQTNNADFGQTDEAAQQLAIARSRAIETGRTVVNISTVGRSQIILPDGTTSAEIPAFQPGSLVDDVPLVEEDTPATVLRDVIASTIALCALVPLLAGSLVVLVGRTQRRRIF
ncbi:apolipoprotein N-acyltransferase [Herbiconiux sp. L3-i23]|uniref:apolipoprotein N-acyltransferase n=1 Tax=Herbiconiux sp. L3-i23 TaxID=2905871 RepID=UPI00206A6E42|nr:apolipoprotein N-acyltransferase [Herbiconiux sp. L3-i23]BDI21251.1 apolipoprotein N-acyltransferase [Herbiconiux sp. L3-i23]